MSDMEESKFDSKEDNCVQILEIKSRKIRLRSGLTIIFSVEESTVK